MIVEWRHPNRCANRLEACPRHVRVPQLLPLPLLVQRSLKHYFINEREFSETTFYSPNQHDLQIQFTFSMLGMCCFGDVFHGVIRQSCLYAIHRHARSIR